MEHFLQQRMVFGQDWLQHGDQDAELRRYRFAAVDMPHLGRRGRCAIAATARGLLHRRRRQWTDSLALQTEIAFKGSFESVCLSKWLAQKDVSLATHMERQLSESELKHALAEQLLVEAMARGCAAKDDGTGFLMRGERTGVQSRQAEYAEAFED